jgi:dimeric dUTPase (all-alpha-NTP-PPase superfamily)
MDIDDADFYNPLLEEYVDGLHFVLEIGIEVMQEDVKPILNRIRLGDSITKKFNAIYGLAAKLDVVFMLLDTSIYEQFLTEYVELGEDLGFTWEEIEQAYFAKNKINHVRQATGY